MIHDPKFLAFCGIFSLCLAFIIVGVILLRKKDKDGVNRDKMAYALIGIGVGILAVILAMIFFKNRIHVSL
jgi:hypothetical protein